MNKFINELENKITIPDEHWYSSKQTPNKWLPSVTTLLDAYPKGSAYVVWLKQVGMNASQILKEAGEIGSNVHSAIDQYVKSGFLSYLSSDKRELYKWEEWELICKAMEFFTIYKPEIIVHEFSFASDKLGFGGTIDMICKINGETWLIDYKSGNSIYDSHYLQIAAYKSAWENLNPQYPIQKAGLLHLKAATRKEVTSSIQGKGWKIEQSESIENDFEYFLYCQKLWHRANPKAMPKILEYPLSFGTKEISIEPNLFNSQK
jgi:hypothetical protein